MGLHWRDKQYLSDSEPYEEEDFDPDFLQDVEEGTEVDKNRLKKRHQIRKALEERMENKKMRYEWDDYEDEIHQDFDWDKYKKD